MASQQCKRLALAAVSVAICAMDIVAIDDVRAKKRRKLSRYRYLFEQLDPHDLQDFIKGIKPPEKLPMHERF